MVWIILGVLLVLWLMSRSGRKKATNRPPTPRTYETARATDPARYASRHDAAQKRNETPGRWVPAGETLKIAGLTIEGGMVYVGGRLEKPVGYGEENCLIDPTLRVAGDNPDTLGQTMPYWPAYGSIHPRARLAYLEWLASGRATPGVGIGFIFLFFYGLERRVFVDKAEEDFPAIAAEVRRLLQLYGDNHSFSSYGRRFLAMLDVIADRGETRPALRADLRNGFELPLDVRFYLGLKLKNDEPLSAEDALLWVVALPDSYLRTPAIRCFDELQALWAIRFAEQWPEGLKVRRPASELKLSYRSASGSFQGSFSADGLPDIASVQAPVARLRDLLGACSDQLDAYSRLIGKRPEARGTLEAATLLPRELSSSEHGAAAAHARTQVLQLMGGQAIAITSLSRVLEALGLSAESGAQPLGQILDFVGVGFEPDRRFGALTPASADHLVLFRSEGHDLPSDLDEFKAARTLVEIAVLAATADGTVDPSEFEVVNDEIRALPGLDAAAQARLLAYALALAKSPPKPQGILNRAGRLDARKRDRLVQAATGAILADGRVTPDEVKYLERLYKALGLPAADVYVALHRGAGGRDEPVTVADAQRDAGARIPQPPKPSPGSVSIDSNRLGRVREQTAAVSSLLSEIFIDDEAPKAKPQPPALAPAASASPFPGLDPTHAQLLARALRSAMSWDDFEAEARSLRLMPEGAIETINDWAFDRFDEPLFEPGESLAAPDHLRAQLQELETAA